MIKNFLKKSTIYIIGDIVNKSIPFLMLPILTRYLTPSDYGVIANFTVILSIFSIIVGLSMQGSIGVNFFKMKKDIIKRYISSCIILLHVTSLLLLFSVVFCYPFIIDRIQIEKEWLIMIVFLAFSQFLTTINLSLWIVEENAKNYTIYQVGQTLVITTISIILIIGLGMNWEGQLIAITVGTIIFSFLSVIFIIKRGYLGFNFSIHHIRDALKFGVPLIPHELSGWIKTGADRLILTSLVGVTATGIYAVGYQLGMIVGIVIIAINKAWSPHIFKILSKNPTYEEKVKLVKFTYIYFIGVIIFSIITSYIIKLFLPIFLGKSFAESSDFIMYISLAYAFQGMYFMVTNYIFYLKKTVALSVITFTTSIIHIILLYFLIDLNGPVGAAQTTTISFLITFLMIFWYSNKIYPMPWFFWNNK